MVFHYSSFMSFLYSYFGFQPCFCKRSFSPVKAGVVSWIKNSTAWKTRWPGGSDKNTSTETALPSKSYENSKNCQKRKYKSCVSYLLNIFIVLQLSLDVSVPSMTGIVKCRISFDHFVENMAAFSLFPLSPIFTMLFSSFLIHWSYYSSTVIWKWKVGFYGRYHEMWSYVTCINDLLTLFITHEVEKLYGSIVHFITEIWDFLHFSINFEESSEVGWVG